MTATQTSPLLRRPDLVWLSPQIEIYGFGVAARFDPGTGHGRYRRAQEMTAEHLAGNAGGFAFASFTFDVEATGSVVIVPADVHWKVGGTWFGTSPDQLPPAIDAWPSTKDRPRFAGSSLPDHLWLEAVASALDVIESGQADKVVLARDHALWSKHPFDPQLILHRLHTHFPECFTFLVDGLVGASPELLVRLEGLSVASRVLAGSAPRGGDDGEDDLLGKQLLASDKNQKEHGFAAASVGQVLGAVCSTLERPATPELLKLENVQHLATPFSGSLDARRHIVDLVGALHPTAAVGGTPPERALALIRSLEKMERGRYAGPVGYFDGEGDGEFAIALRCAELSGARARLFAGGGIVSGSVPEDELEETRLKLRAMLSVLE